MILNFNDAVLYENDVAILKNKTEWLNDAIVHFYFTYLQHQLQEKSSAPKVTMLKFLDPSVVNFFMHQCIDDDDIEDFAGGFEVPGTKSASTTSATSATSGMIFIPINDSLGSPTAWQRAGSGSHWSLLVIVISSDDAMGASSPPPPVPAQHQCSFWHMDSMAPGNERVARMVARKFQNHIIHPKLKTDFRFLQAADVPQQENSYDCGLHTLVAAELVARRCLDRQVSGPSRIPPLPDAMLDFESALRTAFKEEASMCSNLRRRILDIVEDLANAE